MFSLNYCDKFDIYTLVLIFFANLSKDVSESLAKGV